jgi:hypothetical protein
LKRDALDHDLLDHLADALMEDITAASGDDLLAEVEEDFGDAGVLAVAFDEVLAGAEALALRQSEEEAIGNLADALCDDIAAMPPEALLREAAEDYRDDRALVAEFDRVVLGDAAPSDATEMVNAATLSTGEGGRLAVAFPVAAVRSPASLKAAFATLLDWLMAPLRSRTAVAAFAALLLVVILAPGLLERYADRIALTSRDDRLAPPAMGPASRLVMPEQAPVLAGSEPPIAPPLFSETKKDTSPSGMGEEQKRREALLHLQQQRDEQLRQEALRLQQEEQKHQVVAAKEREDAGQAARQQEQAAGRAGEEEQRRLAEAEQKRRAAEEAAQRLAAVDSQLQEERRREDAVRRQEELARRETEQQRMAALPPPPEAKPALPALRAPAPQASHRPAPAPLARPVNANAPEQIRQAQTEHNRLGCFKGAPDGRLNDATREAVKAFWTRAGARVTETSITDDLIADLRRQRDRVCSDPTVAVRPLVPRSPAAASAPPARNSATATGF